MPKKDHRAMKVACLVMAWRCPTVFARAIDVYRQAGWDIYVHLDAKSDSRHYRAILGEVSNHCMFVEPIEVFWGGYSQVEAEFRLIQGARNTAAYDKFILITDDTLPVFPPNWINSLLERRVDLITVHGQPPGSKNDTAYQRFVFYDHAATMMRGDRSYLTELDDSFLTAINHLAEVKKIGKKKLLVSYGSAYWALSSMTVDFILAVVKEDVHLVSSFRFAPQPDESMIQSILRNYLYKKDQDLSPMYADFFSQQGGPRVINSIIGLPFDLQPHQVFVRKIDPKASRFIETVASRLMTGLTAWGVSTAEFGNSHFIIDESGIELAVATICLAAPAQLGSVEGWHLIESHTDRPFRWTAAERVEWELGNPPLPPGRIRFSVPVIFSKPGMLESSNLVLGDQAQQLQFTRHSWIAEFEHSGLPAEARVALVTPSLSVAAPPRDTRMLGVAVAVNESAK